MCPSLFPRLARRSLARRGTAHPQGSDNLADRRGTTVERRTQSAVPTCLRRSSSCPPSGPQSRRTLECRRFQRHLGRCQGRARALSTRVDRQRFFVPQVQRPLSPNPRPVSPSLTKLDTTTSNRIFSVRYLGCYLDDSKRVMLWEGILGFDPVACACSCKLKFGVVFSGVVGLQGGRCYCEGEAGGAESFVYLSVPGILQHSIYIPRDQAGVLNTVLCFI